MNRSRYVQDWDATNRILDKLFTLDNLWSRVSSSIWFYTGQETWSLIHDQVDNVVRELLVEEVDEQTYVQ